MGHVDIRLKMRDQYSPAGTKQGVRCTTLIIIIIIEGLSLLQSIPPTTADKQTQAQKRRGSRSTLLHYYSIYM